MKAAVTSTQQAPAALPFKMETMRTSHVMAGWIPQKGKLPKDRIVLLQQQNASR